MKKYFKKLGLRLFAPIFVILWSIGFTIVTSISLLLWLPIGNISFDNGIIDWIMDLPFDYFSQLE